MTHEVPEPSLDAVLVAQQFLGWNGNLRDRVATEATGEAAAEQALNRATEQLAAQSEILARVADLRDGWAEIVANAEGNGTALQIDLEHIVNTLDRALNVAQ